MILINLAQERGLKPKFVAYTGGGEYHSPCPTCGGRDRFVIQPNKQMKNCLGSYFCRKCSTKGDSIQFCIDHLGFTFKEAIDRIGIEVPTKVPNIFAQQKFKSSNITMGKPPAEWMEQARNIVDQAHACIQSQEDILAILDKRGLPIAAVKEYKIGWMEEGKSFPGDRWGLDNETVWMPAGIIIPTIEKDQCIIRLKGRCKDWCPNSESPKYIAITGSMSGLNIIGDKKHPIMIIVESELDAYALHYVVKDVAVVVAIGGCRKDPDSVTNYLAKNKTVLLICHDNDDAGIDMLNKWQKLYHHAQDCPTPIGKDVGEAVALGLDLRSWIISKLSVSMQQDLNLIKPLWSKEDEGLIGWIRNYISEQTITESFYTKLEEEINLGPDSPRAKTRELQNGLKLMKKLIEDASVDKQ